MAESYRGLTIRIGGDTTKLSQALKAADRSVSDTTSVLKKLNDAIKLDPSSIEAASFQMGAMASNAAATAMKLSGLREAVKQIGSLEFDGKSVKELAEGTRNAQMNANIAREAYNKLTESLAQMYTKVTDLVSKQAELGSKDFAANLKKEADLSKVSIDSLKSAIDQLAPAIRPSIAETEKFLGKVEELKSAYIEAAEAEKAASEAAAAATSKRDVERYEKQATKAHNTMVTLNQEYDKLVNKFSALSGEVFNFDNGNVSVWELMSALESLPDSIRPSRKEIMSFIQEVARLKEAFKEADNELEKANIIAQFERMTAEATKVNASITNIAKAMADMKAPSDLMRGMAEQTESAKALGNAYEENMRIGKEMAAAYKADPTNIEALAAAERAFAAAAQNANENLTHQQGIGSKFDQNRAAIDAFTDSTKSAQQQLNEATLAQAAAREETARLEGNIAEAELRMKQLGGTASEVSKELKKQLDDTTDEHAIDAEHAKEYEELAEKVRNWRGELKAALATEKEAGDNFELAKQRKELEENEQAVVRWSTRVGEAVDAGKALHQTEVAPKFDTSASKQFDALLEKLSSKSLDVTGFEELDREIGIIRANLKATDDQLKVLDAALKVDPTNMSLLEQRTTTLSTKVALARAEQSKLNQLMAQLESDGIDSAAISSGTLAGKLAEATRVAKEGSAAMASYEQTIKDLEKQLENLEKIPEGKRTEQQKQSIQNLNTVLESLRASYKVVEAAANEALAQMGTEVRTQQYVDAKNRALELASAERQVGEEAAKTNKQNGTPKIDEAAFMQVVDRIAQGVRQMGQKVVESANEIDSAYRDMRKTVEGTEAQFQSLLETAVSYSQTHITSADTMLEMQALGGQLGILTEDLEKFGTISSNLDIATDMDAEDIALKLGQISNVLQLDIDGMQGFADALVRLGNNMPAQESSIMAVAQRFGAVAATASFSGEEVLAWSAAIAATGQRSEAAATAISNTVSGIEQAVANGGSDLKQFAAIASMSAEEFKESWAESPTETLRAFIDGLRTLKDSDESAVAALENMGITGVRQQQTLLALTQTIGNLDDALAMSSNAWNEVDDQWGKAGDAAIEADKKSQGFSGALAILKNNVQNLAASMGDSLVPIMEKATEVLKFITDVFNNLPAPVKSFVTEMGGAVLVFSTVTPMLNVFSKGLVGVIDAAGKATSIGNFIAKITGFSEVAAAATTATEGFSFALTGLSTLGIAAAIAGLVLAIAKINEYYEEQQKVIEATSGLTTAMQDGKSAYSSYIEGAQESTRSVLELKDAIKETTEAQANYAEEIRNAWDGISASEAQADLLVQKIEELANKESLTTDEQNELNAAIKSLNNLCGTSVHVLDAQNGVLDTNIDTIKGLADAWKKGLENDQLINQYASNVEKIAEKQALLDEVNKKIASGETEPWFVDMRDGADSAVTSYTSLTEQAEDLESQLASLKEQQRQTVAEMDGVDWTLGNIEASLRETGRSLTEYGDWTDEELSLVVEAYESAGNDSVLALERVAEVLDELKSGTGDASTIAKELEEASKEAAKARAETYKTQATEEYNAKKAAQDAAYNDTKRQYDKEYDALKRQLDREYDSVKRGLDHQYDERKRALDKIYDQQKNAYDKEYEALKRKLDREYDSLKSKLDKQLSAIKAANDAEEAAFKTVTDAYLKELEKRYKAAVKEAEDETDARIDAIDAQIKALEDATKREKEAIEDRKDNDKIAELKAAVESAKSRRKRAEAEKKLNDYLEEVQVKHNERERKEEIERLKEEKDDLKDSLSDKKDALKEQYETERDAYKLSREQQLADLKLANEAEELAHKESNDRILEDAKLHNADELQNLKDTQTAKLDALKASQELELTALKESHDDQLQAVKDNNDAILQAKKDEQSIALENLKAANTLELQEMKKHQDEMYKAIKAGKDAEGQAEADADAKRLAQQQDTDSKQMTARERHLFAMEKRMQEAGDKNIKTEQSTGNQLTKTQENYLYSMEKRMQAMGDANIRTAETSGDETNRRAEQKLMEMDKAYGSYSDEAIKSMAMSLGDPHGLVTWSAQDTANAAQSPFSGMSADNYTNGWHFISNFAQGALEAWNNGGWGGIIEYLAGQVQALWGHSVPKKGPLSDDDKWGGHFVENIVDGMRDKEKELYRQVERMADAVEEGFDPTLTVDAAYEALDTIGKNRSRSLGAIVESKTAPNVTINLNMDLSGVSIREDADIERLARAVSQEMAAQASRQLAGRLG